jgi:hypothetical protein
VRFSETGLIKSVYLPEVSLAKTSAKNRLAACGLAIRVLKWNGIEIKCVCFLMVECSLTVLSND